jgi:hypothetical protein
LVSPQTKKVGALAWFLYGLDSLNPGKPGGGLAWFLLQTQPVGTLGFGMVIETNTLAWFLSKAVGMVLVYRTA